MKKGIKIALIVGAGILILLFLFLLISTNSGVRRMNNEVFFISSSLDSTKNDVKKLDGISAEQGKKIDSLSSKFSEVDKKLQEMQVADALRDSLISRHDSILAACQKQKSVTKKQVVKKKVVPTPEKPNFESFVLKRFHEYDKKFEENDLDHQTFVRGFAELDSRISQNTDDISDLNQKVAENSVKINSVEKRVDANESEIKTVRESIWNLLGMKKPAKKKISDCPDSWQE